MHQTNSKARGDIFFEFKLTITSDHSIHDDRSFFLELGTQRVNNYKNNSTKQFSLQ